MFRKLITLTALSLGLAAIACSATSADDAASKGEQVASTEAQLSFAATPKPSATVATPARTLPTKIKLKVDPAKACSCADHPKPGYDCNGCYMWDLDGDGKSVCYCTYGLKAPTNGNGN